MKSIQLLLVAICCPILAFTQNITGLWSGTLYNDSTGLKHQYEVGITIENGRYTGYSHTSFIIDQKKYFGLKKVKVKIAGDGKVIIEDAELLLNDYPVEANRNVRQLNVLDFNTIEDVETMAGPFVTNRTKTYLPLTGKVELKKNKNTSYSDLVARLQQMSSGVEQRFVQNVGNPMVKND
ncbi:MAG: hypothetical protein WEA59_06015 [Ferruginibacter sp.]